MIAPRLIKKNRLSPIIKWAGGKEQELKYILPCLPKKINRYYEPFVGGGAVYFSIDANKMHINDKSYELINLYNAIASKDVMFFDIIEKIVHNWKLLENVVVNNRRDFIDIYRQFSENRIEENNIKNWITSFVLKHSEEFNGMFDINFNVNIDNFLKEISKNLRNKIKRMRVIESKKEKLSEDDILDNIESALKSAFYMHFRHLYNNIQNYKIENSFATAIFFFIRNFAYSGMFRYNNKGEFNVPYGGIGYNRKNLSKKIEYLKEKELLDHLNKTIIDSLDFEDFLKKNKPLKDDFIFLDPPYDSEFSTYAKNEFTRHDHERLFRYLTDVCEANWMLVIKNTDFIGDLYDKDSIYIKSFNKKYLVNFQNRNDKDAEHLLITNYRTVDNFI